ncbi:MAG: maleylacetoacetate isomerase [Pseudomonadota bacterium]|nr:maleylacetoacetate isomerase [Pseudomonadota bacterium]
MARPTLHDYFRSSAAYRVRIALSLKGVDYDHHIVNLAHGDQQLAEFRAKNPQGLIPCLEIDGHVLTQSLAICDYLDATHDQAPFVPSDPAERAHVLALALTVACDIHPLNNLRVLKYLTGELGVADDAKDDWYRHWVSEGLTALEALAAPRAGAWLFGDTPTLADICLIPQLYNARRFAVPLDRFPTLCRADETAAANPAFAAAHPDRQGQPA